MPLDLDYLRFIVFIIVIAAFVQIVEMIIERVSDALYTALGIFLPLITVNCAILGASPVHDHPRVQLPALLRLRAGRRHRLGAGHRGRWPASARRWPARAVPRGLEGAGITLIIAGIMALAFMGFSGMINL